MLSTYPPIRIVLIVLGLIALAMPFASSADLKEAFRNGTLRLRFQTPGLMLTTTPNLIRRWTLGSTGTGTVNLTLCGWRVSKITGLHRE